MKPQTIGRALGVGLRVAGRVAGQRVGAARQPGVAETPVLRSAGRVAGRGARGVGGFLKPFGRVGGILWLEVTGAFFFLFALVFATAAYRTKPAALHGPYDKSFIASIVITVLFTYLGGSSFLRARRR